jgi:predicted ATPase/DNA-binding CsgD family transcriptional regulator
MARADSGSALCGTCGGIIGVRSASYCSNACRQRAYRDRQKTSWTGESAIGGMLTQLSSFLGRAEELVELRRLLRTARLLTLTGPPGVGKTRLAVELAKQEERSRRCDVTLVDLAAAEGDLSAVGVPDDDRERLLVVDNCEHLLDTCIPVLGALLLRHPKLRILATSREVLRVPGEVVHAMSGLPLPATDRIADHLRADAVRLFVDRARAVVPGLRLTEDNARVIGAICTELDGLPLAIELAARLAQTFPLTEVRDNLNAHLCALTSGWRTAHPRHQSWHQAVTWSYELLTPAQRSMFRRISVLPGGVLAEVAAAVATDGTETTSVVLDQLMALEAKSLITAHRSGRLRMPAPIRHYAHERLTEASEQKQTYDRLADWLTRLAEPLGRASATPPPDVLHRLAAERPTIEHVLTRLHDDDRQLLLAGTVFLVDMLERRPSHRTRAMLRSALDNTRVDSPYREIALRGATVLAAWFCDLTEMRRLAAQWTASDLLGRLLLGLASTRRVVLSPTTGAVDADAVTTAGWLGDVPWHERSWEELTLAAELADRLLPVLRAGGPSARLRGTIRAAAVIALSGGDHELADRHCTDMLRSDGDLTDEDFAHAVTCLGLSAAGIGRLSRAIQLLSYAEAAGSPLLDRPWWRDRVEAVRMAAVGVLPRETLVSASAAGRALDRAQALAFALEHRQQRTPETARDDVLSQRERDVVALLAEGFTNRQIAARMHLSVRTVETHVRNIRTELGLRSRAHVAAWSAQNGSGDASTPVMRLAH